MVAARPCLPAWIAFALVLAGVGIAGCGGTSGQPTTGAVPGGGRASVALMRRVTQSYRRVPAVLASTKVGGVSAQYTIVLRDGVVVAEEFVGGAGRDLTKLVAPPGSPTYALVPGTSCWRKLAPSDPYSFSNVGKRFPHIPKRVDVFPPRRTATGWLLRVRTGATAATYDIDRATLLIRSIKALARGRSTTETLQSLRSAPALISPTPRC